MNFFDDQITKPDSLHPGENLKNCVVNPIVKKNVESRETSQPGRSTVMPRKLKTISKSTSKSANSNSFQAKKNFFEHYMKKGDRRADNRICKDSPGTGHQGRELIGQEGTGKEEKGGAQPM